VISLGSLGDISNSIIYTVSSQPECVVHVNDLVVDQPPFILQETLFLTAAVLSSYEQLPGEACYWREGGWWPLVCSDLNPFGIFALSCSTESTTPISTSLASWPRRNFFQRG